MRRTITYDPANYELAKKFLEGPHDTEANRHRLAAAIQEAIEDELVDIEGSTAYQQASFVGRQS